MTTPELLTPGRLREWPLPDATGDKESRGQLLVLGGTRATPGAVLLAGEAGLRAGAGKLAIATTATTVGPLGVAVPEAQVIGLDEDDDGNVAPAAADLVVERASSAAVVLVGPGFAVPDAATALLRRVLPRVDVPIVIDAVASAYLSEERTALHHLQGRAILNLNVAELALTAGVEESDVEDDPAPVAVDVARRCRAVVLCGGERKVVADPGGETWLVDGGGPGLGVSGSGDVQAGVLAGLLARGADPVRAAAWGAYVHARVGERLAATVGTVGYLARELPRQVPAVLAELAL
jgi:ADP-dependent NAD(P)H-hydrate dehydratase